MKGHIDFRDDSGCWEWISYRDSDGYGRCNHNGKNGYLAHRAVYERLNGPIPEGFELDHLCRNRACVNPAHLEPVTHEENMRRGVNASKTHCKRGHEFTPENTYRAQGSNARHCRACTRYRARVYKQRKAVAA